MKIGEACWAVVDCDGKMVEKCADRGMAISDAEYLDAHGLAAHEKRAPHRVVRVMLTECETPACSGKE